MPASPDGCLSAGQAYDLVRTAALNSIGVDFVDPWSTNVDEIVVIGPTSPRLDTIESLSGHEIHVRLSSSMRTISRWPKA